MGRKPMTEEQRAKMRARILEAARTRFLEEGLDGLSMRSIASLVGVSSMTLYLYYESRQDIVRHIVFEGFTSLNDTLDEVALLGSERDKLTKLMQSYLGFVTDNASYYAAMHRYFTEDPERRNDPLLKEPVGHVVELLCDVFSGLTTKEARSKAMLVWSAMHGAAMLQIGGHLTHSDVTLSELASHLERQFLT